MTSRLTATERTIFVLFLFILSWMASGEVEASEPHHVRILKMEMMVLGGDGELRVVQTIHYKNQDETDAPFLVALPKPHNNPWVIQGIPEDAEITQQDDGLLVDWPLPVGETTVTVGYTIPLEDRSVTPVFRQPVLTEQIDVLIEINKLIVQTGDFLPQSQREQYGGQEFRRFTKLNLQPNEPWPVFFRMYRVDEARAGKEPYLIAGEAVDPSLKVIGHVHQKNIPKTVFNIFTIIFILTVGMISIRWSTKGT
ncbi:hypothetical protein CathTA2_0314 [Caldalkalibacillus thermarum TA2.A1]|uniref:Uncharacterized protein n=1 Tax=Caldalkalibacillus thermarum (strain TA2.A1) TaxID=986075 RepID=F5L3F3_CALTT|nr:hypothetical protein [Caldalkalibacillus thermarum]EGL84132.1 hypothetical protein CathTA2_0314 [Caldalkalibacillus thermarum TA2.A1]QZT35035.1 hypothetical protein HUR95_07340 [Caldalkalibacillus thermarum TA2.A1]